MGEFSAEEMDLEVCFVGNWRTVGKSQVLIHVCNGAGRRENVFSL